MISIEVHTKMVAIQYAKVLYKLRFLALVITEA